MGKLRTWTDEQLIEAAKNNLSLRQTLIEMNLCSEGGGNYKTVKQRIKELELDTSHWTGQGHMKGKTHNRARKDLNLILVENSVVNNNTSLKKRIVKANLIEYKCNICNIIEWQGEKLSLHLDHINGINTDYRLENLRFLCPNCHSLTPTYCGRNKPKSKKKKYCLDCGEKISFVSERCKSCAGKVREEFKIDWPTIIDLQKELETKSYCQLGRELGVSDNAIRKHLRIHS